MVPSTSSMTGLDPMMLSNLYRLRRLSRRRCVSSSHWSFSTWIRLWIRMVWANEPAMILSSRAWAKSVGSSTKTKSTPIVPTYVSPSLTGTQMNERGWGLGVGDWGEAFAVLSVPKPESPTPNSRLWVRLRNSGCWVMSGMIAGSPVAMTRPVTPSPRAYRPRFCSAGVNPTPATVWSVSVCGVAEHQCGPLNRQTDHRAGSSPAGRLRLIPSHRREFG